MSFNLNKDISVSTLNDFRLEGKLLYITEEKYFDIERIEIPNGDHAFSPVKKTKYAFYFLTGMKETAKHHKVTIYEKGVFVRSHFLTRCYIEYDNTVTETEFTSVTPRYVAYGKPISFNKVYEDGIFKYDIYIAGKYFGFVSEFGENDEYYDDAYGLMYLPFDECRELHSNNKFFRYDNETEYKHSVIEYAETIKNFFKEYIYGVMPFDNCKIIGENHSKQKFLVEQTFSKKGNSKFFEVSYDDFSINKVNIKPSPTNPSVIIAYENDYLPIINEYSTFSDNINKLFAIKSCFTISPHEKIVRLYRALVINGETIDYTFLDRIP